jgi:hypothetical protein
VHAGVTAKMTTSTEWRETESCRELPNYFQIQSYDHLLQFPAIPERSIDAPSGNREFTEPLVDAIVVPTIRSAEHIYSAVQISSDARCHLIMVYTNRPPAGLPAILDRFPSARVTVLTVCREARHRLLDLGTSLPQSRESRAALDISRKRNLGALVGRACGWTRMLFLDDDIRKLNAAKLCSAAAFLDHYPVVGLQVGKFPDASVVGHARRLIGRRQEPLVSGGSLLVNPQLLNGYFAPVYHEDWLCVIDHLREGEVAIGGSVGQWPYLPFTSADRARREEFGDILLAGLLWLIHSRVRKNAHNVGPIAVSDYWQEAINPGFWKQILQQRADLIQDIIARLTDMNLADPLPFSSLTAAAQQLRELEPADFTRFIEAWLASIAEWRSQLPLLPRIDLPDKARAIEKVIAKLGLAEVVRTHEVRSPSMPPKQNGWIGGFAAHWGRRGGADQSRFFKKPSWF